MPRCPALLKPVRLGCERAVETARYNRADNPRFCRVSRTVGRDRDSYLALRRTIGGSPRHR